MLRVEAKYNGKYGKQVFVEVNAKGWKPNTTMAMRISRFWLKSMPRVEAKHNNGNDDKQVFVEVNAKGGS